MCVTNACGGAERTDPDFPPPFMVRLEGLACVLFLPFDDDGLLPLTVSSTFDSLVDRGRVGGTATSPHTEDCDPFKVEAFLMAAGRGTCCQLSGK